MSEDREKNAELKRHRVSVNNQNELQFWMRELGVDEATLKDLVQRKAGSVDRIRLELREIRRRG
jgi:hypothetical protein